MAALEEQGVEWNNYFEMQGWAGPAVSDTYPFIRPSATALAGKSVFISGASRGIGRGAALAFAAAGCRRLALAARSSLEPVVEAIKAAAAAAGRPAPEVVLALPGLDVSSAADVEAAAQRVSEAFGGELDVLVNNAAVLEEQVLVGESDPADWWRAFEVNVRGTYLCTRYLLPLLLKGGVASSVLNLTSGGCIILTPGASAYQTTKMAVCRLTECLAREYGHLGLRAFAVDPGVVETDMLTRAFSFSRTPALATDTMEMTVDTLAWLAKRQGDEGNQPRDWLSGRFVNCKWNMEALEARRAEVEERNLLKFRMTL